MEREGPRRCIGVGATRVQVGTTEAFANCSRTVRELFASSSRTLGARSSFLSVPRICVISHIDFKLEGCTESGTRIANRNDHVGMGGELMRKRHTKDPCAPVDQHGAQWGTLPSWILFPEVEPRVPNKSEAADRNAPGRTSELDRRDPIRAIKIDRFTLLERIGTGGMGEVYAAYDESLDRKVAIKLVRKDAARAAQADERLLREARTLARVSHPNVVQVYEVGVYATRVFIAMEFIRGKTLRKWLRQHKEKSTRGRQDKILRQFMSAGRGLEAAHLAGLTHRDFKPENVLIGDDGRARVVDFGLARALSAQSVTDQSPPDEDSALHKAVTIDFGTEMSDDDGRSSKEDALATTVISARSSDSSGDPEFYNATTVALDSGEHQVRPPKNHKEDAPAKSQEHTAATRELQEDNAIGMDTPGIDTPGALTPDAAALSPLKAAIALTTPGTIMGTPRYMAPEQLRARPADHRSDQFSFCVALYEALYDQRPFDADNLTDLRSSTESGQIRTPPRGADVPAPIRKALWRGLSADPDGRFATMGELLAALEHGPTRRRRITRMALAGVAGLAVVGILAVWSTAKSPGPCDAAGSQVAELWSPARKAALGAVFAATGVPGAEAAWSKTSALLDQYATDWRREGAAACEATHILKTQSSELLDRRMACLERGRGQLSGLLDGFAEADRQVVTLSAEAAIKLPDVTVCRDTATLLLGPEPPADAQTAAAVAEIRQRLDRATALRNLGHYEDALEIAESNRAAAEATGYVPVKAEVDYRIADGLLNHRSSANTERAEALLLDAASLAEGARHDQLASFIWLDLVWLARGDRAGSKRGYQWLERSDIALRRLDDPVARRAAYHRMAGLLYLRDGKYSEAIELLERGVELAAAQPTSARWLSTYLNSLADAKRLAGHTGEAEELFERAVAIVDENFGVLHPQAARVRRDFAGLLLERGQYERARVLLSEARATWIATHGTIHVEVGKIHRALANLERQRGDLERAHHHATKALTIYQQLLGPEHLDLAGVHFELGAIDYERKKPESALLAYQNVLEIRQNHMGKTHVMVGLMHVNVAEALNQLGRYEEALASVELGRGIFAAGQLRAPVLEPWTLSVMGHALLGKGQITSAVARLEEAVALFADVSGHPGERAAALWALARALRIQGKQTSPRARQLAESAQTLYKSRGPAGQREYQAIARWLGESNATGPESR